MTSIRAAAVFAVAWGLSTEAHASEPYPGVTYTAFDGTWDGRVQSYHVVEVDLTHPAITLRVSNERDGEVFTSAIAEEEGAVVAINASYYTTNFVRGFAVSDGVAYESMDPRLNSGAIGWRAQDDWELFDSAYPDEIPADLQHAVSGCGWVVRDGVPCDGTDPSVCDVPGCTNDGHVSFNPRTLLGVNEDRTRAYLVAVDGRRSEATGMTLQQCARFMHELGAHDAVNLDGGGSTTMYIASEGGVVNQPSNDQPQRPVPNAVLVHVDPEFLPDDAGSSSDDGLETSAPEADDPTAAIVPRDEEAGCACRATPGTGSLAWLLVLPFALRRRARSDQPA
jgi:hypothetical protein